MPADHSDIHERSLFQLGDWHLVRAKFPERVQYDTVYAIHTGCQPTKWDARIRVVSNICFRCGDAVPDEMQALVKLHHWGAS